MRLQRVPLIVGVLSLLAVLFGVYLMRTSPGAVAQRERAEREAAALEGVASSRGPGSAALEIETQAIRKRIVPLRAQLSAVLGPARRVQVAAEVEGPVAEVVVRESDPVAAGDVLVKLEASLLEAAARRTAAAAQRARANHELSLIDLERQRGLKAKRVGSEAEYDRAVSTERARLADLHEAQALHQDAQVRLDKASIRAPFAGVVNDFDLEPGAYLRPGDPVAEILDLSEIEIEVGVTDRQVVAIAPGDPVAVRLDVFPDETFGGVVTRIGRAPDDQTQKYPVEVRVPNLAGRLLPGMLGRVRFDLGEHAPVIRIPRAATQKEFEIDYVYVLNGRDVPVVQRRRIITRAVPFRPELVEVVGGLEEGEKIALTRVRELRDGLPVIEKGSRP